MCTKVVRYYYYYYRLTKSVSGWGRGGGGSGAVFDGVCAEIMPLGVRCSETYTPLYPFIITLVMCRGANQCPHVLPPNYSAPTPEGVLSFRGTRARGSGQIGLASLASTTDSPALWSVASRQIVSVPRTLTICQEATCKWNHCRPIY